jgi:hypothetical protein
VLVVALAALMFAGAAACTSSESPVITDTKGPTSTGSSGTAPMGTAGSTPPGTAGGTTGTVTTTSERSSTTTTTTSSKSTTTSPASSSTTAGGSASTVATTPADKAFCAKSDELIAAIDNLDYKNDPAGALRALKAAYAELVAAAPPEVAADIALINDIVQAAKTFEELGNSDSPELNAAGERLDAWSESHCGHRLNGND